MKHSLALITLAFLATSFAAFAARGANTSSGNMNQAEPAIGQSQRQPANNGDNPMEEALLPNAQHPAPGVVTGGQPSPEQLSTASERGFDVVVSMRAPDEDTGFEEPAKAEALGMRFVRIPVTGPEDVSLDEARALDRVLAEHGDDKLLIHCGSGNRVGAIFALRAGLIRGKSDSEAVAIGKAHGLTGLEDVVRGILESED